MVYNPYNHQASSRESFVQLTRLQQFSVGSEAEDLPPDTGHDLTIRGSTATAPVIPRGTTGGLQLRLWCIVLTTTSGKPLALEWLPVVYSLNSFAILVTILVLVGNLAPTKP